MRCEFNLSASAVAIVLIICSLYASAHARADQPNANISITWQQIHTTSNRIDAVGSHHLPVQVYIPPELKPAGGMAMVVTYPNNAIAYWIFYPKAKVNELRRWAITLPEQLNVKPNVTAVVKGPTETDNRGN